MKIDHLCHEKLVFKQISTSQHQISWALLKLPWWFETTKVSP